VKTRTKAKCKENSVFLLPVICSNKKPRKKIAGLAFKKQGLIF